MIKVDNISSPFGVAKYIDMREYQVLAKAWEIGITLQGAYRGAANLYSEVRLAVAVKTARTYSRLSTEVRLH